MGRVTEEDEAHSGALGRLSLSCVGRRPPERTAPQEGAQSSWKAPVSQGPGCTQPEGPPLAVPRASVPGLAWMARR